jgi:acetylxylan esterase
MRKSGAAIAAVAATVTATALSTLVALAPSASAASLVQVTNFGTNPTSLQMYEYVPNSVAAHPAILVALHYCGGSGPAFYSGTEFAPLADRYGFIVIYPSVTRNADCFDVSTPGALTHNGNSDAVGVVSMVQYVESHNNGDASRVYATGASSGGMMTNVVLGDYPDVFKAGAAFMGVPFGCFATTDGSLWNTACAQGQISKTPQQWGDLVRGAYPGYSGPRPRMQLWHGTADPTLNYNNFGEEIKQWTNVLGVSQTPTTTDNPQPTWTHTTYADSSGTVQVDAYSIAGAGHVLPQAGMAALAVHFFGLDRSSSPSASASASGSPTPSASPSASASPSPSASATGAPGACRISDTVSAWNTGLTENITITNIGSSAVNGWKLAFTLASGQTITSGWNAAYSPSSGRVTATNLGYNGAIPVGGSTSIGFQATHTGNTAAPTGFTLNGAACTGP